MALHCRSNRQVHKLPLVRRMGNFGNPKSAPASWVVPNAASQPAARTSIRAQTLITDPSIAAYPCGEYARMGARRKWKYFRKPPR